jgi:HD-GYP domain-containing protein (c-di-GMP phosphodiesterase class II)
VVLASPFLPAPGPVPQDQRPDRDILPADVSGQSDRERILAIYETVRQRDILTAEHSRRVGIYAQRLARHLGLSRTEIAAYGLAGRIHDAGKSWMPNDILRKTGELSSEETDFIRGHTIIGERFAIAYDLPEFYLQAIRSHHEWFDGSGYPDHKSGPEIPFVARLLAVVDAFDVITSDRPYREAAECAHAIAEIDRERERQFDPEIAAAFITMVTRHDVEEFRVTARICAVPWAPARSGAWYQIATTY